MYNFLHTFKKYCGVYCKDSHIISINAYLREKMNLHLLLGHEVKLRYIMLCFVIVNFSWFVSIQARNSQSIIFQFFTFTFLLQLNEDTKIVTVTAFK